MRTSIADATERPLTSAEVAFIAGIREGQLAKWRMHDRDAAKKGQPLKGPPFYSLGRRCIRYPSQEFQAWLGSRTVGMEADAAA